MEKDSEIDEGEAPYNKEDDNSTDIDSLCYIDERIQHVLGHFQKDFEGGFSAENLGAKFGGYGSFLPMHECPYPMSHSGTLRRNSNPLKSPKNPHIQAVPDNSKSSSNVTPSLSLKTASGSIRSCHTLKAPKADYSMKEDVGISFNAVADRFPFKDDNTNKSGNSTDQRAMKFRIKMKSNMPAQNNAAIYSGLGLDKSPSSSMGNNPSEKEGIPTPSQETAEESPTAIIQVMSSLPTPGGVLLSPLHETRLNLLKKGNVVGDRRSMSSHDISQQNCSCFSESDSFMGGEQLLNKRKMRIVGQSGKQLELKRKNGNGFEKKITLQTRQRFENKTSDHKDIFSNVLKCTPRSSFCDAGEVPGKASEVSMEVKEDAVKARTVISEAVMGESLESISGQDFDRSEKQHAGNSFMENVSEHKVNSLKDNLTDPKNDGKCKANMVFKKIECDTIQFKAHQDSHAYHTNQRGKLVLEGKDDSEGDRSSSKAVGASRNSSTTDKKRTSFGVTSCKSQLHMTKSSKYYKVTDNNRDSLKEKNVEHRQHRAITNVNCDNAKERSAYRIRIKERLSGNKVVDQLISGLCSRPIADKKLVPEMVPAAVPEVITEDWVCCDSCQKWRLLPLGVKPDQLPEKWLCSMLNWMPGMNRCYISEEETTKAVYALNQMPNSGNKNSLQNHASGTASGVGSAGPLHCGVNRVKSSFDVMSGRGKKKQDLGDKTKAGINRDVFMFSKSLGSNAQESGQTKLLTDTNQCPGNSNPVRKSIDQHLIRLNNLNEEKHMPKEKVKVNGGGRKNIQLRRGIEADHNIYGISKKSKTELVCYSDNHLNPDTDQDMVEPISRKFSSMKVSCKGIRKYDDYCLSEDTKNKLIVPAKKLGDQAQVLSNGVPLGAVNVNKKDESIKKRKLKGLMDDKKQSNVLSMQDYLQYGEEGSVSGFRKEKKRRVLKTKTNSATERDIEFDQKVGRSRICLSGDDMAVDTDEIGNTDKAQLQRKHKIMVVSQHALDCNDPLGRDLGSEQLSLAATSSSSIISGSHRARTNFEDVKVSPVESFTSSPLRTFNLDKLIFVGRDTSGKDAAEKGGLSSMSSRDNKEEKKSMKRKKEVLDDLLPEQNKICSVLKVNIPCTTESSIVSQQNLGHNSEKENKADSLCTELIDGKLKSLSSSDGDVKSETVFVSSRTGPEAQKGDMFNGHSVNASGNGDLAKLINARSKARVGCNSGNFAPDRPDMSSPMRVNSSLTASMTLDEATKLKDMADNFKSSGFEFESNETYFEAALKFLHGASLLEYCHNEGSKHGEMSQMQLYATTAKLFESCALEYQRHREMAAAALAYKCMEVACMRLVYCKHSCTNGMQNELQSTLNMVPQGESPSSSVSDVDNTINLATVDKTTLSRGTGTHLATNQVISLRNRSTFFQLLDFTQDVNLAMEASRKCQSNFAAACTFIDEGWNKEHIASIRRVVDFSFQDVYELVRLVSAAKKAITRAGLDGVRD